jgi:hypothetical protein
MGKSKSIMQQIWRELEEGKTPKQLIAEGFAPSTVYAVTKKHAKAKKTFSEDEARKRLEELTMKVDYLRILVMTLMNFLLEGEQKKEVLNSAHKHFQGLYGVGPPRL